MLFRSLGLRSACALGFVAFSHWLLDLPVHRADMPLLPGNFGNLPMLGLGLWQYRGVVAVLEFALVVLGAWLYWRAARSITEPAQPLRRRALLTSVLMLLGGIGVLLMDLTGA